jgi:hypothetical protein
MSQHREQEVTAVFWPIKIVFKLGLRIQLIALSALAGMAVASYLQLREEQRTWGVLPKDAERALPGDDLIGAPDVVETRSLPIDAAPADVWPWLVQMGWGRGGWYSYDQLDMDHPSADTILEEFQDLAEGDVVPTHPGGGFEAKVVEPEKTLVLYLDSELVESHLEAATAERAAESPVDDENLPAGLQAAGAMGDFTMPEFRATWTFVLESESDGSTRLVERMRIWGGDGGMPQRLGLPLMGVGVFLMTRKHMFGVKERAERLAAGADEARPVSEPSES